jgi:hypothetical protein
MSNCGLAADVSNCDLAADVSNCDLAADVSNCGPTAVSNRRPRVRGTVVRAA